MARRRRPCCTLERAACITAVRCAAAQGDREASAPPGALRSPDSSRSPFACFDKPHGLEDSLQLDALRSCSRLRSPCCTRAVSTTVLSTSHSCRLSGAHHLPHGAGAGWHRAGDRLGPRLVYGRPGPMRSDRDTPRDRLRPIARSPTTWRRRPGPMRSVHRAPCDRLRPVARSPTIWRSRRGPLCSDRGTPRDRPRAVSRSPTIWKSRPARHAQVAAFLAIGSRQSRGALRAGRVGRPDPLRSPHSLRSPTGNLEESHNPDRSPGPHLPAARENTALGRGGIRLSRNCLTFLRRDLQPARENTAL